MDSDYQMSNKEFDRRTNGDELHWMQQAQLEFYEIYSDKLKKLENGIYSRKLKKLTKEMLANLPEFCEQPEDWEHLARCIQIVKDFKNPIDFIEEDSIIEDYFFNPPEE